MKEMTRQEWDTLKDEIVTAYEGKLRVLRLDEDGDEDGICLLPLKTGSVMGVPKLLVERQEYDKGYVSYCMTARDVRRDLLDCLPFGFMSAYQAKLAIEFAAACLFGVTVED